MACLEVYTPWLVKHGVGQTRGIIFNLLGRDLNRAYPAQRWTGHQWPWKITELGPHP